MNHDDGSIKFPRDAAPHPFANLEWWYCYAFLTGAQGNRYALMASFFRIGELPVLKGHYLIHSLLRVNDKRSRSESAWDCRLALQLAGLYLPMYHIMNAITKKQQTTGTRRNRNSTPQWLENVTVQSHPTRLKYGRSELTFADDLTSHFHLQLSGGATRASLHFAPVKPVAIIDAQGSMNGLQYYSVTRNTVTGELYHADTGVTEPVSGEGWFDHQWGRNYGLIQGTGWDWFGLQLDDGRDVLINRLRAADSAAPAPPTAILIGKDGAMTRSHNVTLEPLAHWQSLYTGVRYPVEWRISLPDLAIELHVTPLAKSQEIPIIGPMRAIWEGACKVSGHSRSEKGVRILINGHGFTELVGYAD
ncbi:lipocalin family protein [Paenibacillus xerothermodurans]|uniref:lipocalin family protein n=1 Tax=Paenibacillus xerothermodurans TaxID=1977292 RepID=UPI001401FB15|nr:lipocalin family protein [Paenibacillus xerothermodurans]